MKLVFALVMLAASASVANAAAPCDNALLMKSLGKLQGSPTMAIARTADEVRLELVSPGGKAREVAVRVTCDAIEVPLADHVDRPTKGSATRTIDGIVLSRTANGAVSLDFGAGIADAQPVSMLVLDDDSISIVRGDKLYYAFATQADGTTVETEGIGNGCGCERTTDPAGKVTNRRLLR